MKPLDFEWCPEGNDVASRIKCAANSSKRRWRVGLELRDPAGMSHKTDMFVEVLNVNEAPELDDRTFYVEENKWIKEPDMFRDHETGALSTDSSRGVGSPFAAFDPDYGDELSYSITAGTTVQNCLLSTLTPMAPCS